MLYMHNDLAVMVGEAVRPSEHCHRGRTSMTLLQQCVLTESNWQVCAPNSVCLPNMPGCCVHFIVLIN